MEMKSSHSANQYLHIYWEICGHNLGVIFQTSSMILMKRVQLISHRLFWTEGYQKLRWWKLQKISFCLWVLTHCQILSGSDLCSQSHRIEMLFVMQAPGISIVKNKISESKCVLIRMKKTLLPFIMNSAIFFTIRHTLIFLKFFRVEPMMDFMRP